MKSDSSGIKKSAHVLTADDEIKEVTKPLFYTEKKRELSSPKIGSENSPSRKFLKALPTDKAE